MQEQLEGLMVTEYVLTRIGLFCSLHLHSLIYEVSLLLKYIGLLDLVKNYTLFSGWKCNFTVTIETIMFYVVLFWFIFTLSVYFISRYLLYSNERESKGMDFGGWGSVENLGGNHNHISLYEKDLFSTKRKNCVAQSFHHANIKVLPLKCFIFETFSQY